MEANEVQPDDVEAPAKVASKARQAIEVLLRKTRAAYLWPLVFEGFLWLGATFVAVFLSAGILGILAPRPYGPDVFIWVLGLGSLATLIVGMIAAGVAYRQRPSLPQMAMLIQSASPDFRSDIVAALQFAEEIEANTARYSEALSLEHVQRTLRAMYARLDSTGTLAHVLTTRSSKPAWFAFLGGLAIALAMIQFVPHFTERVLGNVTALVAQEQRPLVGDIDILLTFPAYTKKSQESEAFSTGNVEAITGTEVTLRTYPLVDAQRFEIVLKTDEDERTIPVRTLKNLGILEAKFVATKSGTYQFRATLPDGHVIDDGISRTVSIKPDMPPRVNITTHKREVEVSPGEVLEIGFVASDDFGIQSVARIFGFSGEEPTRVAPVIPALSDQPGEFEGKMTFDLGPLNLQPKDTVVFQLEIIDNNSLTGPGRTLSEELVLKVSSPDDKHQKLVEQQQALVEGLVVLLADYLETNLGERMVRGTTWSQVIDKEIDLPTRKTLLTASAGLSTKTGELLTAMAALAKELESDPLMIKRDVMIFSSVETQLSALHLDHADSVARLEPLLKTDRLMVGQIQQLADQQVLFEDSLEKSILRLEDLLASQKMEMVKATTEEIKALKDRLKELLEKYRDTQDPELKETIKREIGRLRQRMSELMQRMQDQLHRLPQEHVNMDAIKNQQLESDAKKMADSMTSIEEMLDKGDIDGALAALENMDTSLDELTKEMDQQFGESQPDSMNELDKKVSELMDQVNDLETLQQEVEKQTEQAHQDNLKQVEEKLNEMVKSATAPILDDIREQKKAMQDMGARDLAEHESDEVSQAMRRLDALEKSLRDGDVEEASEQAGQVMEDLRSLQFGLELAGRYTKAASKAGRDLQKSIGEMPGVVGRGKKIQRDLAALKDKARQEMASPNQQGVEKLGEGQKQVNEQADKLAEAIGKAGDEFPVLAEEMRPAAESARKRMGEAGKQIGEGQFQPALDEQHQALDELRKLKDSMRETLQKQKQGANGKSGKNEKVQIPEHDDSAKETYREDVMKNMREGRLENYDEDIRRYYESLME